MPENNLRLGATFHDDARDTSYRIDDITFSHPGLRGAVPLDQIEHRRLNNGALAGIHGQRNF